MSFIPSPHDWYNFYDKHLEKVPRIRDSDIGHLFWFLHDGKFPILPDDLDCYSREKYNHFNLRWYDRFSIVIPYKYQDKSYPFILESEGDGPTIKFDSTEKLAEHLNENIEYYRKKASVW